MVQVASILSHIPTHSRFLLERCESWRIILPDWTIVGWKMTARLKSPTSSSYWLVTLQTLQWKIQAINLHSFIHVWLVVSTHLKNMSQWEGLSHILWKIKHVPNHQPDVYFRIFSGFSQSFPEIFQCFSQPMAPFLGNFQWFHAPRHFRLSGSRWLHMTRQGLPTRRPLPGPGARPGDVSWLPPWYTKKTSIESIEFIVTTLNYTIRYYKYHKPNQYSSYEPCIYIYTRI